MKYIGMIGLSLNAIVTLVVGLRMLVMVYRTRQLPELMIALLLLVGGVLGLSVLNVSQRATAIPADVKPLLGAAGVGCQYIGAIAQLVFAWRVFHPGAPLARALYLTFIAVLVGAYVFDLATGMHVGYGSGAMPSLHYALGFSLRAAAAGVLAVESLFFLRKLKRQLRLELTTAAVVQRVRYWGVGMAAVAVLYTIGLVHRLLTGESASATPPAIMTMGLLGVCAAVCYYLAFLRGRSAS